MVDEKRDVQQGKNIERKEENLGGNVQRENLGQKGGERQGGQQGGEMRQKDQMGGEKKNIHEEPKE